MTAIMLHHIHGGPHKPSQGSLSADQFRKMLGCLDEFDELVFDDGLKCQFDIAYPILMERKQSALFCVCTGHLDGQWPMVEIYRWVRHEMGLKAFYDAFHKMVGTSLDWGEVAFPDFYSPADREFQVTRSAIGQKRYDEAMAEIIADHGWTTEDIGKRVIMSPQDIAGLDGMYIGLHSHTHPLNMGALPSQQQRAEYQANLDWLSAITGGPIVHMSHPSNSYSPVTLAILNSMGIKHGYRADETGCMWLEKPRVDHRVFCREHGICA